MNSAMLDTYFTEVEHAVRDFPYTTSYVFEKKFYNATQGFLKGIILFKDESVLEFVEVKDINNSTKLKYRYHYRDKTHCLIFRYDNAPHHKALTAFPHHKHETEENVINSSEPELLDILREIRIFLTKKSSL